MKWWVHELYAQGLYAELLSQIFWVLLSITLHELAHGWAAIWQGDNTPITYQRMTLNPIVHMGGYSLIMFAICGIAWGVMPVDPSRFRWKRRGRIVVAGAGPAMNLLIALVTLTGASLWMNYGPSSNASLYHNVWVFLMTGGWLNVFLAMFNLLPVPPLDGSDILSGLSFTFYRWYQNPQVQQIGFFILLVIFISDIGWLIQAAASHVSTEYVFGLIRMLPGGP
jgi:Zn-dependent protease